MEPIILASGSLRRQEYFKLMGLPFNVMPAKIEENLSKVKDPEKLTSELAVKKIEKIIEEMRKRPPKWVCGVDTVIAINNKIFGKPKTRDEAGVMLKKLSGRKHKAVTSVALYNCNIKKMDIRTACCKVNFAQLSDAEIEWYLDTNEWQGVAGAYRIQGLASCFITGIEGAQTTVVGLPLHVFYVMLRDNGYPYGA
ncbi:MAG: Maf family protein [Treponema sp.]|nr:Maf family protein [Treponema sp.]